VAAAAGLLAWIPVPGIGQTPERVNLGLTPSFLMMRGPYRFKRNPMYFAELGLWLGWAVYFGSAGVLMGCAMLALTVGWIILPREERGLEAAFEQAYLEYRNRVPRLVWADREVRRRLMGMLAAVTAAAGAIVMGIGNAPPCYAQPQAESRVAAFDVASVRPAGIGRSGKEGSKRSRIEYSPKSVSMWNVDVAECVEWAFNVRFYQVSAPGVAHSERYDILAKTADAVQVGQLREMLQNLLAKRFQLKFHRETKMLPVYDLVVAKGGPRLPAPKADADFPPTHGADSLPRVQDGSFVFQDASVTDFAAKLSLLRGIELPVIDRTGIKGVFDITLKSAASALLQPDGPSLFTLVQEQLGLRLVAAKAPVEVLVIEHVGKPSEN